LLVVDHISDRAENLVKTVSSAALKKEILSKLINKTLAATSKLPGAKRAERTVLAQDACLITECEYTLGMLTDMLPGKAAVIDHLAAWCNSTPGWDSLMPIINELRSKRCPRLSPTYHPNVFDLDLASASETKFKEAVKWLSRKQAETREAYGFFIPAADVEAVQILEMCRISSPCSPIVFHPFSIYTIYSFPLYYILWGRVQLGSVK
jgi:hypothetical protein